MMACLRVVLRYLRPWGPECVSLESPTSFCRAKVAAAAVTRPLQDVKNYIHLSTARMSQRLEARKLNGALVAQLISHVTCLQARATCTTQTVFSPAVFQYGVGAVIPAQPGPAAVGGQGRACMHGCALLECNTITEGSTGCQTATLHFDISLI